MLREHTLGTSAPGTSPRLRRWYAGHCATPHEHDSDMPASAKPGLKRPRALVLAQEGPQNARRTCAQRFCMWVEPSATPQARWPLRDPCALLPHPRGRSRRASARPSSGGIDRGRVRTPSAPVCAPAPLRASPRASRRSHASPVRAGIAPSSLSRIARWSVPASGRVKPARRACDGAP